MSEDDFYDLEPRTFNNKVKGYLAAHNEDREYQLYLSAFVTSHLMNASGNMKRAVKISDLVKLNWAKKPQLSKEQRQERINKARAIQWQV